MSKRYPRQLAYTQPASYVVFIDGVTIKAQNCKTGRVDFSGTDASTVIQSAINALTGGRTWKEKVLIKGNFVQNDTIKIPSYTALEIAGRLILGDGVNKNLVESSSLTTWSQRVEIFGGVLDGNKANNPIAGKGIHGIFRRTSVENVVFQNFREDGIHNFGIIGGSETAENVGRELCVRDSYSYFNERYGVFLDRASGDSYIFDSVFGENGIGICLREGANLIEGNHLFGTKISPGRDMVIEYGGNNVIVGNYIEASSREGLLLDSSVYDTYISHNVIVGNVFWRTSMEADNTYSSIRLLGGATAQVHRNLIGFNVFQTGAYANRPRYCVEETVNADDNTIIGNKFYEFRTAGAYIVSSSTLGKTKHNSGFATENSVLSGTFAIDSVGVKTVTIAHGLDVTPAKQDIAISVVEETDVDDWRFDLLKVDTIGAVNVTVKVNVCQASATAGATARIALRVGKP